MPKAAFNYRYAWNKREMLVFLHFAIDVQLSGLRLHNWLTQDVHFWTFGGANIELIVLICCFCGCFTILLLPFWSEQHLGQKKRYGMDNALWDYIFSFIRCIEHSTKHAETSLVYVPQYSFKHYINACFKCFRLIFHFFRSLSLFLLHTPTRHCWVHP